MFPSALPAKNPTADPNSILYTNGGLMFRNGLTVVKFGSSVLRGEGDLPVVVEEIARWLGSEQYVLAVISAFGNTT